MREILFRGKRTDNGEWVEGNYNGKHIVQWEEKEVVEYPRNAIISIQTMIDINPDTISQYTGLTDKNGQKIWVGDIVRYQFDNDDCPFPNKHTEKIIGRIFFSDWRASFSVTAGRNGSDMMNNDLFKYVRNGNRVEVIGNIYDNPELLKAGDDDGL